MGIYLILGFMILGALGVPIAVSLALSAVLIYAVHGTMPTAIVMHRITGGMAQYILLAIPFFILAGQLMNTGGITKRIFNFANTIVGYIPGGLGHANVVASIIFAGMSGSAVADAGGLGAIELQAMKDEGFDLGFRTAVTISSSVIGPIIPPSIPMVVYGVMAEVSTGALFMGGVIPGLLMGLALMAIVYFIALKADYPRRAKPTLGEIWDSFKAAFLPLVTPVIIIGGIISGVFTPTEAAVVASVYALLLGAVIYRELTLKDIAHVILDSVVTSATVVFVIGCASSFAWLLAIEGVPNMVTQAVMSISQNPVVILLVLNIIFLILGMFMEALSIMVILVPVIVPLIKAVGIDPLHFGLVMVLNLMIGLATPPFGMSLYTVAKLERVSPEELFRPIIPFIIPLVIVLFMITYIPGLVLWLPRLIMGYTG